MTAVALGISVALRRARVPKLLAVHYFGGGCASWLALFLGGLDPALALVPIMPFLPHAARDPGFFADAPPDAMDTLNRFEMWWRYPASVALFFFGLVNAGCRFERWSRNVGIADRADRRQASRDAGWSRRCCFRRSSLAPPAPCARIDCRRIERRHWIQRGTVLLRCLVASGAGAPKSAWACL